MSKTTKMLMLSVALMFDLAEAVLAFFWIGLIINRILTIIEYSIFLVWFKMQGVTFLGNSKKITSMGGSFIVEIIPFLGALPGFTAGVYFTIRAHEQEIKNKKTPTPKEKNPNVVRHKRA